MSGTIIKFVAGRLITAYANGNGLWFNTDARVIFEQGSAEFSSGNSGWKTVFPWGTTKAQIQFKSKEISTQQMTRDVGMTWTTGSYQTLEEKHTVATSIVTLAHTPFNSILSVYGMSLTTYAWTRFLQVSGAPGVGEFSIAANVLTFNIADEGTELTIQYNWNNTTAGLRGLMPTSFIPSTLTGTFRQLMGERQSNAKSTYLDWYFKDVQPATDRLEIGVAVDNLGDDYTETYNIAPSSILYVSQWTEP